MGRLIERMLAAQAGWARPFGDFNHRWLSALFRPIRPLKDLLSGTWLGHPLHAATTDVPVGALIVSLVLDVLGQPTAAQAALIIAILFMALAALSGLSDYTDTDGTARERATVHATVMVLTLLVLIVSAILRATGTPTGPLPIGLSVIGLLGLTLGAFIGGDVVYVFGNMVSRHAFRGSGTKWLPLELPSDLGGEVPEGTLVKAKLGINTLVLVRQGDAILALHDQCAHAGGPLSGGTIVGDAVECPWHGSRFRLADGRLRRGPALYDQPAYEVRRTDAGSWEARRAST